MGEFESTRNLINRSEKELGVKLIKSGISAVCVGKKKTYKGFQFKYKNNAITEIEIEE